MPTKKNKKKGKKTASPAKKTKEVVVREVVRRPTDGRRNVWAKSINNPWDYIDQIPDWSPVPSATCRSVNATSQTVVANAGGNYGLVAAFQCAPRRGETCFRTIASAASDVITWAGWFKVPNFAALEASVDNIRPSAAGMQCCSNNTALTSATGYLVGSVDSYTAVGGATTTIRSILNAPMCGRTDSTINEVITTLWSQTASADSFYSPVATENVNSDQLIMTVALIGGVSGQRLDICATVNWEAQVLDLSAGLLSVEKAPIDLFEYMRGMRVVANMNYVRTDLPMRSIGANGGGGAVAGWNRVMESPEMVTAAMSNSINAGLGTARDAMSLGTVGVLGTMLASQYSQNRRLRLEH